MNCISTHQQINPGLNVMGLLSPILAAKEHTDTDMYNIISSRYIVSINPAFHWMSSLTPAGLITAGSSLPHS